ncbi:MAG: 16S rRNA (cytosine(1402)-N(4))-methyltransferase RsmH, partial [bacterium]|nr:16S rRNA (cytosine(1402)-N(4))-methyltransferase RsmH [bacterium]
SVLAIDIDEDAITHAKNEVFKDYDSSKLKLIKGNFESVYELAEKENFLNVDGIVFDIGVSSFQLDNPEKGFSFLREGPIDMRMDNTIGMPAGRLIDILDSKSLSDLIFKFSDEMYSRKIAEKIVEERENGGESVFWENKTTTELAEFISVVVGGRREKIHPATRVFQALRMAVNDEVGALNRGLVSALDCLTHGGVMCVVCFHSVEERIIDKFMTESFNNSKGSIFGKVITPDLDEIERNPRSRSAKLKVFIKGA